MVRELQQFLGSATLLCANHCIIYHVLISGDKGEHDQQLLKPFLKLREQLKEYEEYDYEEGHYDDDYDDESYDHLGDYYGGTHNQILPASNTFDTFHPDSSVLPNKG